MSARRGTRTGARRGEGVAVVAFATLLVAAMAATTLALDCLEAPVRALVGAVVAAWITVAVTLHTLSGSVAEWSRASARHHPDAGEAA